MQRVGVIGGGQLAWMMGLEAQKLGASLWIQTPNEDDAAVGVAEETIIAELSDLDATGRLADACDVLTFENEFVDQLGLSRLQDKTVFHPSLGAIAPLLDKFEQRCFLQELGIPIPEFRSIMAGKADFQPDEFPLVIKARRQGYDGQGTFIVKNESSLQAVWEQQQGLPVLVESYIPFDRELAVMAARGVNGEMIVYPVVETYQQNQVCQRVIASARISEELSEKISAIAQTLLSELNWVGILGIEFFLTEDGQVLVNEIAPRTHNSGHYTIDACDISQFAMHIKAVIGDTLTSPQMIVNAAVMVNLLGYESAESDYLEKRKQLESLPNTHLYWYGKHKAWVGRKLGHVTVLGETIAEASAVADQVSEIWYSHDNY